MKAPKAAIEVAPAPTGPALSRRHFLKQAAVGAAGAAALPTFATGLTAGQARHLNAAVGLIRLGEKGPRFVACFFYAPADKEQPPAGAGLAPALPPAADSALQAELALSLSVQSAGVRVQATGIAGALYELQAAEAGGVWRSIGRQRPGADGRMWFVDRQAPAPGARFYRMIMPEAAAAPLVTALQARPLSATTARLSWRHGSVDPERLLLIEHAPALDGPYQVAQVSPAGSGGCTVSGLHPLPRHYFRLRPANSAASPRGSHPAWETAAHLSMAADGVQTAQRLFPPVA